LGFWGEIAFFLSRKQAKSQYIGILERNYDFFIQKTSKIPIYWDFRAKLRFFYPENSQNHNIL
jgi:hypothetical protein